MKRTINISIFKKMAGVIAILAVASVAVPATAQNGTEALKVLCLGNSITKHAYAPSVEWYGNWGMAASKAENDYCHVLQTMLSAYRPGSRVTPLNIADWERNLSLDIDSLIGKNVVGKDIVVIRLGENVSDKNAFPDAILRLVRYCKTKAARVVITGCYWYDAEKETAIKTAARTEGIAYIPISQIYSQSGSQPKVGDVLYDINGKAYTISKDFILMHPGDKGMLKIAKSIYAVLGSSDGWTQKVNVHKTSGTTESFSTASISEINFAENAGTTGHVAALLELKAGGKLILAFSESPKLSFDGDTVEILSAAQSAKFATADVSRLSFQNTTSIANVGLGGGIGVNGGMIAARGITPRSTVTVFDTSGMALLKADTDASGNASLDTSSLPSGVYIVKAGTASIKFVKQ